MDSILQIKYAAMEDAEKKCICARAAAYDSSDATCGLEHDHGRTFISLHQNLLQRHYDYFRTLPGPSSNPSPHQLAGRMWYHGIHLSLEVLRKRQLDTITFMLSFIDMANGMLMIFNKHLPIFKATWMEMLGDLARYHSAIRSDAHGKLEWSSTAKSWYFAVASQVPMVGRLNHHLALVARMRDEPALHQLYLFSRSLNCAISFPPTRVSIKACLLDRILRPEISLYPALRPSINTDFIKTHAHLAENNVDAADKSILDFIKKLDTHIDHPDTNWNEDGVYIACINIASWFDYSTDNNVLHEIFFEDTLDRYKGSPLAPEKYPIAVSMAPLAPNEPAILKQNLSAEVQKLTGKPSFARARYLTTETLALVLRRIDDKSVLPHVHVVLSFCTQVAASPLTSSMLNSMPWTELCALLNTLIGWKYQQARHHEISPNTTSSFFTTNSGEVNGEFPLPEDYSMRGLVWAGNYFPDGWFAKKRDEERFNEEARYLEEEDILRRRIQRILWLGHKLAQVYQSFHPGSSSSTSALDYLKILLR